ncbi:carbohydrate binding protein [Hypnocyclicus thermotrophus]|uniref:Carbohydrate binding protein n=1 Tax=Hypnocyclicus thermotrophus TaxID=1627895 RepID=A0AA46I5G0_9FUSO|nr:Ig-like domain-containing protein [Hypnocyclicus thermotrophus]TDT70461.1 carbohydrate binding protein [Hypnocyclicus thermotrophus]
MKKVRALLLILVLSMFTACLKPETTKVEGVSISGDSSLNIGETIQLSAVIEPIGVEYDRVVWKSLDTSIATVSDKGVVTGIKEGTTIITLAIDGNVATKEITVTAANVVDTTKVTADFLGESDAYIIGKYEGDGGSVTATGNGDELIAKINAIGSNSYSTKVYFTLPSALENSTNYTITFDIEADEARDINVKVGEGLSSDPWWNEQHSEKISVITTKETKTIAFTSTETAADASNCQLVFELGNVSGTGSDAATTVRISNISLLKK